MSSEETMSVGGSEEVRALEYGDVSMTSELSDSERTEEGVGRDADIVGEVKQYESELGTRDSLGYLVESYEISSRVLIRPAGVEERVCFAPRDHWMPVYAHYLAVRLMSPIPELLVGLLLDYSIGLTQLVPNAMRGGSRKDKGWYYFTPRVANRESRSLFTAGPSSIKGWKEKFFFVNDTEWERGDAEVELLSSWKAKRANQNKFSLNEDEEEEVGKLVREGGKLANIMYFTNAKCIEAAELYGPSALSEAEMDKFLNVAGGVAIPKKQRKKSNTSTKEVGEGGAGKEVVPSTSAGVEEVVPRLELKRKGSEEVGALQRKKRVVEEEVRGSEVLQFVPRPPPIELDPELRESEAEGAEVRAPGKGKGLVPPLSFQSSLFKAKNMTGLRRFINATFPEVNKRHARDKALRYLWGIGGKAHFGECELGEWSSPGIYGESKGALPLAKAEKEVKMMKEAVMELKKNVQLLVHNGMEEHISNFVSSSSFDDIVNFYRLPTAILVFTDCRKKVKAEYPEVDITKITFGEQENGVEEKFVAVEEEKAEVEDTEVGAGVEGAEVDESQPPLQVEIHPVPSDDEQPPLSAEQQPTQPPPPAEE
ncbi:hypothetical protein SLEP1_g21787 [Rubroshorea leprosula]|uniref:Uncharacterized protein n=1 Tax=Rubroshorea leprosula TaxID=152421 RepID=A0AAV5JAA2_9ROSI|nr:hypothetical protein SLEP1_g21787 [Rubroshorea leprosula]